MANLSIEKLREEVEEDLQIDQLDLSKSAADNPKLAAKYINYLLEAKGKFFRAEQDYKRLYKEKYEYYTGKAPPEEYKENPLHVKIMKQDLGIYLDADDELQRAKLKRDSYKMVLEYLEYVVKSIQTRNFDIKNIIEWNKFQAGG